MLLSLNVHIEINNHVPQTLKRIIVILKHHNADIIAIGEAIDSFTHLLNLN